MYLTVKQQVKHLSKEEYKTIKELCHTAKNLTNEAIYNVRQYYFTEGEFLKYEKNYTLLKNSPNYKALNSNMAQQILKEVDLLSHSLVCLNLQNKASMLLRIASYHIIFRKMDIQHLLLGL